MSAPQPNNHYPYTNRQTLGQAALKASKSGHDAPHTYSCLTTFPESSAASGSSTELFGLWPNHAKCCRGAARSHTDTFCLKATLQPVWGASCLVWQRLTLTLKVMASITKMRSGKTLATSSTLLKYLTGSRTSRACSRSLNFPTKEEHRLLGQACLLVPPSCHSPLSQSHWNSSGREGRFALAGGGRCWSAGSRVKVTTDLASRTPGRACGWVRRLAAACAEKSKCKEAAKHLHRASL